MGIQYIVAITAGSLFVLLLIIGACSYLHNRSKQRMLWSQISAMYNDSEHVHIDYDFGFDNEATRVVPTTRADGQLTIEDVLFDGAVSPIDEGMEEITGNYNPD